MNPRSIAALLALVFLVSCAAAPPHRDAALGTVRAQIVALVPFVADDLYAIGAGSQLRAVSSFTDDRRARGLPRIADYAGIDAERIVGLHPDVAIGIPSQEPFVGPLRRTGVHVVLLHDDAYPDIFSNLRTIGALCGRRREASVAIARLLQTTTHLRAQARTFVRHPSVFVVLGSGPIWTAGSSSYIATLIRLAGGVNAADDMRGAYGQYSAEALLRAQPDVLVTGSATHLGAVMNVEPWRSLRAVRLHHVYTVDPAAIIMQPGPEYNRGLRWLVERLTPLAT